MDLKYKYYIKKIDGEWQILPVSKITSSDGGMYEIEYMLTDQDTKTNTVHFKYLFEDFKTASLVMEILNYYENVMTGISDLNDDLDTLSMSVNSNSEDISELQSNFTSLESDVSDLESDVSDHEDRISDLESKVAALEGQIP